jgi:hypothetical protein
MSRILYFAIASLILSNIWTLTLMLVLYHKEVGRLKEMWHAEERAEHRRHPLGGARRGLTGAHCPYP